MINREDMITIGKIAKRAEELNIVYTERHVLVNDIRIVHSILGLRFDDWLQADDFNFAHDIVGIQNHIDRENNLFDDTFLPRFTSDEING